MCDTVFFCLLQEIKYPVYRQENDLSNEVALELDPMVRNWLARKKKICIMKREVPKPVWLSR